MTTFKIHPVTITLLLAVLLAGYFNYFLMVALVLFIHDIGHIIMIKIFKYKIKSIEVLPFGSMINTDLNVSASPYIIFFISVAGVLFQALSFPIAHFFLTGLDYEIFMKYNVLILVFNLLPVIPLDGSKIMSSILEMFTSYKKSLVMTNIISIISIITFWVLVGQNNLNNYMIIGFLFYKTYEAIKNHVYTFNNFLLNRYLKQVNINKIRHVKSIKQIYKTKYNFVNGESETKALRTYFNRI